MDNEQSPVEDFLLKNGWRKSKGTYSKSRAIYWLPNLSDASALFGHADYCRTNDRPPPVAIYEYAAFKYENQNEVPWGYELVLIADTGKEWADLKFYSLRAEDIVGRNSKLKKLGSQLVKMWNYLEKEEMDDE